MYVVVYSVSPPHTLVNPSLLSSPLSSSVTLSLQAQNLPLNPSHLRLFFTYWMAFMIMGLDRCLVQRLQSVQNAAARFVTGTRRCEHITPVLRRLHWLPVRERIRYKLLALVHRALSGQAPEYLVDDCQLVSDSGRRPLRSAERSFCLVPRCNSTFGDRSFAVAGPRLWNSLPTAIRNISLTIHTFGKHLKTHFFF